MTQFKSNTNISIGVYFARCCWKNGKTIKTKCYFFIFGGGQILVRKKVLDGTYGLNNANCLVDNFVNFQLYGLSLSIMSVLMELYRVIAVICVTRALLTTSLPRAFRRLSSSLGSQLPTSLHRSMPSPNPRTSASSTTTLCTSALCSQSWGTNLCSILLSIFLGRVTLACHRKSLSLSANLAQRRSLSASVPSFSLSFIRTLTAPNMTSFKLQAC